jgi:hypothetical protein
VLAALALVFRAFPAFAAEGEVVSPDVVEIRTE